LYGLRVFKQRKKLSSRFEVSGIRPLNFTAIQERRKPFQDDVVDLTKVKAAPWITSYAVVLT
jgi:hypothetical protein